jgi:hypothetical protein
MCPAMVGKKPIYHRMTAAPRSVRRMAGKLRPQNDGGNRFRPWYATARQFTIGSCGRR